MKKRKTKIKIKKKTIEKPKYQSEVSKEEHGRQGRVKFWIGDFIDNESTPVETRDGVEVKIVNVIGSMGHVCGNILNDSYRELQEWNCDGVYLKDWIIDDPRFDLFFSSTGKNPTSVDVGLRPHTYDELCNLHRRYINRQGVLKKDTKEPFRIMNITQITDDCYRYLVSLCDCNKGVGAWVNVSEKELLEHYTWSDDKPCGVKRGRQ